ncbi:MAG: rhodanese-like domain-containing protein [Candidatus Marinimicrobia bacterium]|nr:rhodanese-like domain-containing protein [Candidatus Neomarinimicrobiota bacterium]MCF7850791.1 rhodanese-like domain-containing protein [Candidatus Neomarinimicrobiota bacterium]MCF7904799.1 rhodanese-like domain-containing protein [Candidatus Neomarinimicrobiota bacterium]
MIYRLIAYSLILLGVIGTVYLAFEGIYKDEYTTPSISRSELDQRLMDTSDILIIDVRNKDEIRESDSLWEDVIQIPLFLLEKRSVDLAPHKDKTLVLVCPNGKRSKQGASILRLAGYDACYLARGIEG